MSHVLVYMYRDCREKLGVGGGGGVVSTSNKGVLNQVYILLFLKTVRFVG